VHRCARTNEETGATAKNAKRFYESCGFAVSPVDPMTPMMTVADAEQALGRG
jgi:hypothetical protein